MSTEIHDRNMLEAIGPLCGAGFAVHWLHARQKRPIGNNWQAAPVATSESLRASYAPGNNLGLRVGEPSLTPAGFLLVIDLDIRIADLADEAWAKLRNLLPELPEHCPKVASGSGGASRHVYLFCDKPFFGKKLAVSEGKHRRFDTIRKKDVWSYDWEIELFGTGKQVAMPPSIHPDTGKPYTWEVPIDFDMLALGIGPTLPAATIEALGVAETVEYAFESREPLTFEPGQLERDLATLPVTRVDDYHDWIMLGQALHHQFGGSDEGYKLWVEQSKRSTKFDGKGILRKWRGFGKNRRAPVTMATVRQWAQEARSAALIDQFDEFDEEGEDSDDLPEQEDFDDLLGDDGENLPSGNFEDLLGGDDDAEDEFLSTTETKATSDDADWRTLLHLNEEGEIKPTLHNITLIVENDVWTRAVPAYNEFTQEIVQRGTPGRKASRRKKQPKPVLQLEGASWILKDRVNGDFWTEDKDNHIRRLIEAPATQGGYGIKIPDRDLRAAIDISGRKNCFHPVREYLNRLTWDGTDRVERLFIEYLGAPDDSYHRAIARMMMAAAVTRVFEPGAKFDFAVILEGLQGKRKSTFISVLARHWFSELHADFEDTKMLVEQMQGAWIMEIPELSQFQKGDVRRIKAFLSSTSDKVRLAYAKRAQEYPRQCIMIGSTNDEAYLKDDTGGRRWWPVRCAVAGEIDTDKLAVEVDQLWAEALNLYRQMREAQPRGTLPLYLTGVDARAMAERLQESRKVESVDDVLIGQLVDWLDRPINDGGFDDVETDGTPIYRDRVCLPEIWTECMGNDMRSYRGGEPAALGRAMRRVPGWRYVEGSRERFGRFGQQRYFIRLGAAPKPEYDLLG
jgi:hypothetical protein